MFSFLTKFCCVLLVFVSSAVMANDYLAQLAKDIGDKRIVFLDELTHGEKEVFKLKADITQYLHQHHGFDAIVLESGMFDMEKLWTGNKSVREQASGNIFYMYANEPIFHPLLRYIDEQKTSKRPLILAGFDGRLSGELSIKYFTAEFENKLKLWLPDVYKKMDWVNYKTILNGALKRDLAAFNAEQVWFEQQSVLLIDELMALETVLRGYASPQYYAHLLDGLLIVANNLWGKRRFDEHDIAMANNLDWLLQTELKNKKVVVWGQFIHVNKRYYTTSKTDNVTSAIKKRYPGQTYVVHFSGLRGQYRDFVSGEVKDILSDQASAESWLWSRTNWPLDLPNKDRVLFQSKAQLNSIPKEQNLVFYGLQYRDKIPAHHWSLYWDGIVLMDAITPSS